MKQFISGQFAVFCRKCLTAFAFCLGVTGLLASSMDFVIIRATSFLTSSSGTCCEDQEPTSGFSHLQLTRLNLRLRPRAESGNY
jgi:hypothetical protein